METDRPKARKRFSALVTGYIGYQNTGDELLLRAMIRGVERHALPIRLAALSRDPESTERQHRVTSPHHPPFGGGVRPTLRTRITRMRAITRADILILGPGGLLQDYDRRGIRNIFTLLRMVLMARAAGVRVIGVGLGAGPLVTPQGRRIAGAIGRLSDLLLLRDVDSVTLMNSLGVPDSKIRKVADLALAGDWQIPPKGVNSPQILGVSIFNFHGYIHGDAARADADRRMIADALDNAASRDIRIRFISMQGAFGGNDELEARKIRDLMRAKDRTDILPYTEDPEDTLRAIAQCDWFLGMRLHSLIMALMASVPMAALSYHPKVASFMADIDRADAVLELESLTTERCSAIFDELLDEQQLGETTISRRVELAQQADDNFSMWNTYLDTRTDAS